MHDFFISYNKADEHWAKWFGDWLDQAGYTTIFQQQDFVPATNFAAEMHKAILDSQRMIMVLSPDYLSAKFPLAEWTAAFASDPACERGTLIPVRVRECKPVGLLRPIVYIDLVGLNANDARNLFLSGIESVLKRKRARDPNQPSSAPQKPKKSKLSQKVKGHHNTNVQAERIENLTIKMTGKKAPSIQPPDVVGANVEMRSYVEYLIDRYIEWRQRGIRSGIDKRRFHPSMIHRDVKRDFGARTYLVPERRFRDLVHYLQVRINDTITGRNSRQRNYHSFEEHLDILHGKKHKGFAEGVEAGNSSLAEAVLGATQSGFQAAGKRAQEINCINNLKQLGLGARLWAIKHGGVLPPDFASMKEELATGEVMFCPADTAVRYEILSPGVSDTNPSLVYARCPIHKISLLADGSVLRGFVMGLKYNFDTARATARANACINNLRQIDSAIQQWALENQKRPESIPTEQDIAQYLKGSKFPTCPAGGTYKFGKVSENPVCSIPSHLLPN